MVIKRISKAYFILGRIFGTWISPFLTGILIIFLRLIVGLSQFLDQVFFPGFNQKIINPIIIVGNPRSGTTFLHRFLIRQNIGTGSQLWQLIYPSIFLQKLIKPILRLYIKNPYNYFFCEDSINRIFERISLYFILKKLLLYVFIVINKIKLTL